MNTAVNALGPSIRHRGPGLGWVALVFTILFNAGLLPVTVFGGRPFFPGPWESVQTMTAFFQARPTAVLWCAFLHFGAAVSLGVFTATVVSRLRFLGVRAAGAYIALAGGFLTAFNMMASASVLWTLVRPGIAQDPALVEALYSIQYAFGGPGFSAPLGLLIAGVSVTAAFMRLLPKWVIVLGLALAGIGELSSLSLILPGALFLIPLTRFPAFVWLIAAGFLLPSKLRRVPNPSHAMVPARV
jgi:hypothetical protein